ncbi:MAG: methyltransferase [Chloroflexi bacterium]|nr:methyltransferase [Chloroflexota bacterium]
MTARGRAFVRHWTRIERPALVPEIRLHLAGALMPLWEATARDAGDPELPPPYWAFAWAGGQALARHVLDHPELVRGRRVLDLATGSGLCAIAAALAGAREVRGVDIDPLAIAAVGINAPLNDVHVAAACRDLLDEPAPDVDVILAGDIGYEWNLATRGARWLRSAAAQGIEVRIGDPERHHLPPEGLEVLEAHDVPTSLDLEQTTSKHTTVLRVMGGAAG